MPDFVDVQVSGIESVLEKLLQIESPATQRAVMQDVGHYIQGKLKRYPPYQYVSRKSAYGVTFFTDKQRRWFFAALRSGELQIPYPRTRTLRNQWVVADAPGGDVVVRNFTPYVKHVQQESTQSRMMQKRGWQTEVQIVRENAAGIAQTANESYNRYIKRIGA